MQYFINQSESCAFVLPNCFRQFSSLLKLKPEPPLFSAVAEMHSIILLNSPQQAIFPHLTYAPLTFLYLFMPEVASFFFTKGKIPIIITMYQLVGLALFLSYLVGTSTTSSIQPRSDWALVGCFSEPTDPRVPRLLSSKRGTSATALSLSTCARFCATYLIFGVENGTTVRQISHEPNCKPSC